MPCLFISICINLGITSRLVFIGNRVGSGVMIKVVGAILILSKLEIRVAVS